MKGLSVFILFLALLPIRNTYARQSGAGPEAKKIRHNELPQAVKDAVSRDFPKAAIDRIWRVPLWVCYADWQVSPGIPPDTAAQADHYAMELTNGQHYKGYVILTGKIKRVLEPGDHRHH